MLARFTFLMLALVLADSGHAQRPTTKPADPKALLERWFEADPWTAEGRREQAAVLAEIDAVPAFDAKAAKKWHADALERANGRPRIEKKSGRHWFWEKPAEKGLYYVGGETGAPKGLLIALHGGGAGSGDATSALSAFEGAASKRKWLVIAPEVLVKTEHGWTDSGTEEFVLQLLDAALRTWKIDRDRVFFAGHSMGGYGTWTLGARHADRVAGLAPSAGAPTPVTGPSGSVEDIIEGVIPNLRNVRIAIYQSDDDPRVPPIANRVAAKKLGEARDRWGGFPFEYWEVPGRQHDECPGGMDALLAKIDAARRSARPEKLVWQPVITWKRQFHWLWWGEPKPRAIVEAEVDRAKNEVRVICSAEPKGLEVLLDDELLDLDREVVVRLGDQEVFRGKPELTLGAIARSAANGDPGLTFIARVPLQR